MSQSKEVAVRQFVSDVWSAARQRYPAEVVQSEWFVPAVRDALLEYGEAVEWREFLGVHVAATDLDVAAVFTLMEKRLDRGAHNVCPNCMHVF